MAILIDGKVEAARLRQVLVTQVQALRASGRPAPNLRVILVGDHPASRSYVRTKTRVAAELGIDAAAIELPTSVTTADVLGHIGRLNADPLVHGILVQLPLPSQIEAGRILGAIDPRKDVDGFHPMNVGRLVQSTSTTDLLVPCTPRGCLRLLEHVHGKDGLRGAHAVVLGRSNIVGKPMAALLLAADCTVTVAHSKSRDLPALCRTADVLVAAVGRARMVRGDWVRAGATVIDVGINRLMVDGEPRLVGDVDFDEVAPVAGAITPVPGGVGPMTVACLMENTLTAARLQGSDDG